MMKPPLLLLFSIFVSLAVFAQHDGLLKHNGTTKGYVLFAPLFSKETYLIDRCGQTMHSWRSRFNPAQSVYLLDDGSLLHTGNDSSAFFPGGGGKIERISWDGTLMWQYTISDSSQRQHHDICPLPNGNILVLVWEKVSRIDAIRAGRDSTKLGKGIWSEKIVELKPLGRDSATVVWQWRAWDHVVQHHDSTKSNYGRIDQNPGRLNLNYEAYTNEDWLHFNSLDYNPAADQVLVSNRNFSEIFIIDHSASTSEAATNVGGRSKRGGELLYRWGNPEAYGKGIAADRKLYRQHTAHWIKPGMPDAGKVIFFNNGLGRTDTEYSSVEIIDPIIRDDRSYAVINGVYSPLQPAWRYEGSPRESFFSTNVSSAQQLANGNVLICEGAQGKIFEVDANKSIQWVYESPVGYLENKKTFHNPLYRATYIAADHPAVRKRKLKSGRFLSSGDSKLKCQSLKSKKH